VELRPATLVKAGLWIIGIGWAPVIVIGLMDPHSNPIGLALIAWAGTMIGAGVVVGGIGLGLYRRLARRTRRS
jgi:hypothetical protein